MSNSPDIWSAVNGLNQQGYEGALGASAGHQTQLGSYNNLQPTHGNLVSFPSSALVNVDTKTLVFKTRLLSGQDFSPHSVLAAEMNRGLPPMSTFHRNNTVSRSPSDSHSENPAGEEKKKELIFTLCCML